MGGSYKKTRPNPKLNNTYKARGSAFRPELKYIETAITNSDPTQSGSVINLTTIGEGSDFNNRIGRKCNALYLEYAFSVDGGNGAFDVASNWTLHIAHDKNPNGASATAIEVLDSAVVGVTGAPGMAYAFKNKKNGDERFTILKTETGFYDNGAASGVQANRTQNTMYRGYLDLSKLPGTMSTVQYNSTSAVVPISNTFYAVLTGGNATNTGCLFSGNFRFVFTD